MQHDYNIANQSFPSFRTDLNNALSAIQTCNSGTSRPTGAVAGQIWLDTTSATSPTLKIYDGADDISLATINYTTNTVDWLDSSVSITGLSTTATGTVLTLADTYLNLTQSIRIPNAKSISDDSGNSYLTFAKTASAVNQLTITNTATTVAPSVASTGTDTNIDLFLTPKGIGLVTFNGGGKIQHIAEKITVSATAATGTINYDVTTQAVLYYTSNASANWTLNIRGDGTNSLNSVMDIGESLTVVHAVTNGTTAYYNSALQVDGSSVTPKYQGGTAPTSGNASSIDVYSYTVIKTASATFTVLASQTQFK
jgi:hypothetical protein